MRFRLIVSPVARGAWNMGLDRALMDSVRAGGAPVLRFYRWSPACVSLGRNQPAANRYDAEILASHGLDVVRRPTGGRAVLHDEEVTYSVVVADRAFGGPRGCYAAANRALRAGVRRLGVPAELQPRPGGRAVAPSLSPCFDDPAEGELVVAGRKLVGSAQVREGGVLLQHGSLLIAGSQARLRALLRADATSPGAPRSREAVLADLLDPVPEWDTIVGALAAGWEAAFGASLDPSEPSAEELERASLHAIRFADPAWTWRC